MALLASLDSETLRWGKRWLERFGFHVETAATLADAETRLAAGEVEIVVVDDSLRRLGAARAAAAGGPGAPPFPVLALCSGPKDAGVALDEGTADVACKPFAWRLIGQQAARLVRATRAAEELASLRADLSSLQKEQAEDRDGAESALDALTGLPGRKSYERSLENALAAAARTDSALVVLLLDLDRFRQINETWGRQQGNQVLRHVAGRLAACLRGRAVGRQAAGPLVAAVARLEGDTFSMMVSPVRDGDEMLDLGRSVLNALAEPVLLDGVEVYVSASLGMAAAPIHGHSPEVLLHRAELAMAESRRRGGGLCRLYGSDMPPPRERALKIDRLLRRTLERNELELHYQPIVDARSRRIVGAEALLRWRHPELGDVPPLEFIPVAEESGFMVEIGHWVLRTACGQLRAWMDAGLPAIRMAINVSLCQFMRGNLPALLDETLAEARLPPSLLELELSERGVLRGDPDLLRQLHALRARGVRLSVDDFGTGDSAIAYLKRFPLDTLKVDQSFVAGALANPNDAVITSAMIAMAHSLSLRVVAEGVEEQAQVALLEGLQCEELQGYLFSKAVPADEFERLLGGEPMARASRPLRRAGGREWAVNEVDK
jgi:diguanylate cyclase (GGDEF)-like protein